MQFQMNQKWSFTFEDLHILQVSLIVSRFIVYFFKNW